eukprot:94880_1
MTRSLKVKKEDYPTLIHHQFYQFPKKQKIFHPSNTRNKNTLNKMDQDVKNNKVASLVSSDQKQQQAKTNINHTNHSIDNYYKKQNHHINHNHNHTNNCINSHINNVNNNEEKELSPIPINNNNNNNNNISLLFQNENTNENTNENINNNINNNIIATPMGFNLSEPEIINLLLQYLDNA